MPGPMRTMVSPSPCVAANLHRGKVHGLLIFLYHPTFISYLLSLSSHVYFLSIILISHERVVTRQLLMNSATEKLSDLRTALSLLLTCRDSGQGKCLAAKHGRTYYSRSTPEAILPCYLAFTTRTKPANIRRAPKNRLLIFSSCNKK